MEQRAVRARREQGIPFRPKRTRVKKEAKTPRKESILLQTQEGGNPESLNQLSQDNDSIPRITQEKSTFFSCVPFLTHHSIGVAKKGKFPCLFFFSLGRQGNVVSVFPPGGFQNQRYSSHPRLGDLGWEIVMSTIQFCGKQVEGVILEGVFFEGTDSAGRAFLPLMMLLQQGKLGFSTVAALQQVNINWFPAALSMDEFEEMTETVPPAVKETFLKALEGGGAFF